MPTVQLPNNWRPRSYQLNAWRYLESGGKRAIMVWHRRAGKDDLPLHWTACSAMTRVGGYWHMLPEQAQARKAIWNSVNPHTGKRRIDEAFPEAIRANTRDDEMLIRFKNGSTWQVLGSDRYDSLVGSNPIGVVFSEWALANPAAWAFIRPIMLENGGWAIFNGTPRGKNHLHTMFRGAQQDSAWFTERLTARQTGVFSEAQLARELEEYQREYGLDMGQSLFEQEYEVSWDAAILGAYYGREMVEADQQGRIGAVAYEPGLPVHSAWDIGMDDATAIWWFQVVWGRVRVLDFARGRNQAAEHYAGLCDERERGWKAEAVLAGKPWVPGTDWVPHDARVREWGGGRTRLETLKALGRRPKVVRDHTVQDGINAGRQTIALASWNEAKCADGLEALRQYRREWNDERKVFKVTPLHDWASDPADAWRYLSMAWREAVPEPAKPADRMLAVGPSNSYTMADAWRDMGRGSGRI